MLKLRSSGHLESYSSRVLTLVGLHDPLPKCLMNLSRKSLMKAIDLGATKVNFIIVFSLCLTAPLMIYLDSSLVLS
jgi:hypothetical protein